MNDYTNPNFDITKIPYFNSVDGLNDISQYLDFAISSTIRKQIPNVTREQEQKYANTILNNYLNGSKVAFTSQNNIRNNINAIGLDKIKSLLLKNLIETEEYNKRVLHQLVPTDYEGQCAEYVTSIAYNGQLGNNNEWINNNMPLFVSMYVSVSYGVSPEIKEQKTQMCYANDVTRRALEQLNLEMSLKRIRQ